MNKETRKACDIADKFINKLRKDVNFLLKRDKALEKIIVTGHELDVDHLKLIEKLRDDVDFLVKKIKKEFGRVADYINDLNKRLTKLEKKK